MSKTKHNCQVFHFDLYGQRETKYAFLNENSLSSINWNELEPNEPNFFLVNLNESGLTDFNQGFKIDEIFGFNTSGMVGGRDALVVRFDSKFDDVITDFKEKEPRELMLKYNLTESRDWSVKNAKNDIIKNKGKIIKTSYKAFDFRFTYYTGFSKGFVQYPRQELVKHFENQNFGLSLMRNIIPNDKFTQVMVTDSIIDKNFYSFQTYLFPLYLYPDSTSQPSLLETNERTPNLNLEIIAQIEKSLGLSFEAEPNSSLEGGQRRVTRTSPLSISPQGEKLFYPIDILDYIYAVLHSSKYRETYKEFLKIDFPRVPFPTDAKKFWKLVEIGKQIREIHLLESPITENYMIGYPEDGDNIVTKPRFVSTTLNDRGKVYINETQYFSDVPEIAWNFYIGGYQPAQKWLKDRKERELSYEDILHYQKIIVALTETDRLMKEVDKIGV